MENSMALIYGIGVNDWPGLVHRKFGDEAPWREYERWMNMLRRVATVDRYDHASVSEEFRSFRLFKAWLDTWSGWSDLQIDKDILGGGEYGPDTCLMVTRGLNQITIAAKAIIEDDGHGIMEGDTGWGFAINRIRKTGYRSRSSAMSARDACLAGLLIGFQKDHADQRVARALNVWIDFLMRRAA